MNQELPYVQAGFRKGRGTRDQTAYICWIIEKARELKRKQNINLCIIDYTTWDAHVDAHVIHCLDHNKLSKILKEVGIPDHLTCLMRNLYASQKATDRTRHGTMDRFKIGKEVCQGCILLPCLFRLYAEYTMQNAGLDESQAEIKIAERNNNLRYADDIILIAESKEKVETVYFILFPWAPKSLWMVTAAMQLKRCLLLGRKAMSLLDRDITFASKGLYSQNSGFSSSHVQIRELVHKEG